MPKERLQTLTGDQQTAATATKNIQKSQRGPRRNKGGQLHLDSNEAQKFVLIKITRNTGVKQIISFALPKIKEEWTVELNGFSLDIAKVLTATEIIKSRAPFLHQSTKLITSVQVIAKDDKIENPTGETKTYSGVSVTLSKNPFESVDSVGYQKPKPRTFI